MSRRHRRTAGTPATKRLTLVLANLAAMMERADELLLPAVFSEVGAAFHASPSRLGALTLLGTVVQSCCYPLAVYMAARHNRAHVISLGAFLWAAATSLLGFSSTYSQIVISRGLNGIGLALVNPAIQSLVADITDDANRGVAFGWLQLTGNVGSILGGIFSLSLATTTVMGIPGWRVAFHLVAIVSVIVGMLVRLFAVDPHFSADDDNSNIEPMPRKTFKSEVVALANEARAVMKVPSFQVIVAQGVAGSFPWFAMSFGPMWLELVGFTHLMTGLLVVLFAVSGSLGGLFGGFMGDYLSARYPNAGRIILSQISSGSAIPLAAILFLALPEDRASGLSHGVMLFIMGFTISWNDPATKYPIFAEIVPEKARTHIFALDRSFEPILASFAPPIVGLLAENVYGYKPIPEGASSGTKVETDKENAASLAKALYITISIPMSLCSMIYSFLYCTYPRDRERARMESLLATELQQIEMDGGSVNDTSQMTFTQLKVEGSERTQIGSVHKDGETDEANDQDERRLLS